jgi:hypothetical protein
MFVALVTRWVMEGECGRLRRTTYLDFVGYSVDIPPNPLQ